MNPAWYLASWFFNFISIAIIVGLVARALKIRIEEHKISGAFFIFFLPVLLELVSFLAFGRPFVFNLSF